MSQLVTITSVTANTPVSIYYCDSMSANCQFVSSVSVFPYSFTVPSPLADSNFIVKIVDCYNCVIGQWVYVIPTNTPTQTPTSGLSPTPTPTNTATPTNTNTSTPSPTLTRTPTKTPIVTPTRTPAMTPLLPCVTPSPTQTPGLTPTTTATNTQTPTETPTNTPTETPTSTPSETPTNTPTETPTNTQTPTNTPTETTTQTPTQSPTNTQTPTPSNTETPTQTPTNTPTPTATTPLSVSSIDVLFLDGNSSKVYSYNPSTSAITYLFSATTTGGFSDIAATQDRIFLSNNNGGNLNILVYSYTQSPFTYTYLSTVSFAGLTNSTGLTAKNNNLLVVGYNNSNNIDELNLTTSSVTNLFTLPTDNFTTGDIVYNSGNTEYAITYYDNNLFDSYVGVFNSSGVLQYTNILLSFPDMYGIYAYNNKLWGVDENMNIYYLNFTNGTYSATPTQPVNYNSELLAGASNTTTQISWIY